MTAWNMHVIGLKEILCPEEIRKVLALTPLMRVVLCWWVTPKIPSPSDGLIADLTPNTTGSISAAAVRRIFDLALFFLSISSHFYGCCLQN
jgi:hypothetical protein